MNRRHVLLSLLLILALTLTTAIASAAFPNPLNLLGLGKSKPTPTVRESAPPPPAYSRTAADLPSFAPIAKEAMPTVVNVSTSQTVRTQGVPQFGPGGPQDPFFQFFRHFFPQIPRSYTQRALGSGVIIDPDGYIVTNAHVVKNADKIVVKLQDKREFDAKVVGIDEKTDVALLKIKSPGDLAVARLGDSDAMQVGDWVIAIGNPFGLSETVTAGIVSAKGRVIGEGPYDDFIQTDASINPGNSGGPLLNLQGQVIGINSAIFSRSGGNIGIGFAIPINIVKSVVEQLKEHGKVIRGWLGVTIQNVTPELATSFGLKKAEGALVGDVSENSPASRAGIERGDIIIDYNGAHVEDAHQLPALVAATKVGKTVSVTVLRNGEKRALSVTVAEMPAGAAAAAGQQAETEGWGLRVSDITPDVAQQFNLSQTKGVVVTEVAPNSPADQAGLQPGDVIAQVNRHTVDNVADYRRLVAKASNAKQLLLLVERQGEGLFVVLHRGD
jgi:serine protease Do